MGRFILRRTGLALLTLWLLGTIVFLGGNVLPGNVARNTLGPFASQQAVNQLNHQLGTDRPLLVQYWSWLTGALHGNLGMSYKYQVPVVSLLGPALLNSLKLALVAFIMVVPLGILGGILAGLSHGGPRDRLITTGGMSATVVPEFVWAILFILLFAVEFKIFPVTAAAPAGSNLLTQFHYLILPAIPLLFVLFGYIARITRAGVIEALDADFTRTAVLKGLSRRTIVVRHVLRNALLPTIAVIATQSGYLIGGLVVIETIFNYQGIGQLLFNSANYKDFPLLEGGVLVVGAIYLIATLIADIAYSLLNPRIRYGAAE